MLLSSIEEVASCLYMLKGPKLSVLVAILKHTNADRWASLSVKELERITGYKAGAIEKTIRSLQKMKINDIRLMLVVTGNNKNKYLGRYHFLVFPTIDEI
jgi:DNA-binding MarR family transcriptional regulator